MRNQLLELSDRLLLHKRALIEMIIDQLKNVCQIEHARHRSPYNFLVHLLAELVAHCHQAKQPSLGWMFTAELRPRSSSADVLVWEKSLETPQAANLRQFCDTFATVQGHPGGTIEA